MAVYAFGNQGGSAGKSTSVTTIGGILASRGRRVRIIDSDAQSNASTALGITTDPELSTPDRPMQLAKLSTSDVLNQIASIDEAEVSTQIENLTLVPSSVELDSTAVELTKTWGGEQRLRRALVAASPVDITLIDCPGALSILTVGALVAADFAITVTQPGLKEMAGIPAFEETIEQVRDSYNSTLRLAAIIPCVVPPPGQGKVYEMALDLLRETFGDLVTPSVRRSTRVPEAYSHQVPLHVHAPKAGVTEDYIRVIEYLTALGVL